MMTKFPLLEQLRAQVWQRDQAITEPYRHTIDELSVQVNQLRETVRQLQEVFGTKIGGYLAEQVAHEMRSKISHEIMTAAAKATGAQQSLTITLDLTALRFLDDGSLEAELLRRYARSHLPKLNLSVIVDPERSVTMLDIRIPEMGYRTAVAA